MTANKALEDAQYEAECAEIGYHYANEVVESLEESICDLYRLHDTLSECAEAYNPDGASEIGATVEACLVQLLNAKTKWIESLLN